MDYFHRLYKIDAYVKYVGGPLYKFSKKHLCDSQFFGINVADLPASIILGTVWGLVNNDFGDGIIFGIGHQIGLPIYLYRLHLNNVRKRKIRRVTIDDLV